MFVIGLDLGQAADYTAITVVEVIQSVASMYFGAREPLTFHCRHLARYALGTTYPAIADSVRTLMDAPELEGGAADAAAGAPADGRRARRRCALVVDATGVGQPVVDMLRERGLAPTGITITAGGEAKSNGLGGYNVPKRDLVGCLQVLLQTGRLKFAAGMPDVQVLVDELLRFQVKVTPAGNDAYESWREGAHDDLVLALALACWYGERNGRWRAPYRSNVQPSLRHI